MSRTDVPGLDDDTVCAWTILLRKETCYHSSCMLGQTRTHCHKCSKNNCLMFLIFPLDKFNKSNSKSKWRWRLKFVKFSLDGKSEQTSPELYVIALLCFKEFSFNGVYKWKCEFLSCLNTLLSLNGSVMWHNTFWSTNITFSL